MAFLDACPFGQSSLLVLIIMSQAENDPTAGPPGAIGESLEEIVTPYDEMMSMIHEQLGYCDDQIKQIGIFNRQ